nr:hypothetical protein [Tanacetum cinerariifolium]
ERHVVGARALDDFHQAHLVHRTEEVHADEALLPADGGRQARDGQGRGVGRDHRIGHDHLFSGRRHLRFEFTVFEHRFNDQVAAFQ